MKVFDVRTPGAMGLKVGRQLGEGSAGKVYAIPDRPGYVAKIYHDGYGGRKAESKIDAMLARAPDLPAIAHEGLTYWQIAWPVAKLYDDKGSFCGFLMPEIDFRRSTSLVNLLQRSSRRAEGISDYYGYRLLVARNIASVSAELHRAGHHMIDMKPANLRFYPSVSWIAVVDTDGFSIAGKRQRIPATQVSDEYVAPEGWQKKPAELGEAQDCFALAVIIFQLLNNGLHPFAGAAKDGQPSDLQGRIQAGLYAYGLERIEGAAPGIASIHKSLRRSTRELFDRAFRNADDRPSAVEWRDHLDGLLGMLVPCSAKPDEHAHFGRGCGFCAHEAQMIAKAFARTKRRKPEARGVPLGPPAQPSHAVPFPQARPALAIAPYGSHRTIPLSRVPAIRKRRSHAYLGPMVVTGALLLAAMVTPWQEITPRMEMSRLAMPEVLMSPGGEEAESAVVLEAEASAPVLETPAVWAKEGPAPAREETRSRRASATRAMPESKRPRFDEAEADSLRPAISFDLPTAVEEEIAAAPQKTDPCLQRPGWVERQLCGRPALAEIDSRITLRYRELASRHLGEPGRVLAKRHQRWLQSRTRCALTRESDACLDRVYRAHMQMLARGNGV